MLNCFLVKFRFWRAAQSGFFLDFFIKKSIEWYIRNLLIYTAQFFGEKYFIENLTKKFFEFFINSFSL